MTTDNDKPASDLLTTWRKKSINSKRKACTEDSTCAHCSQTKPSSAFSTTQLRKGPGLNRCLDCVRSDTSKGKRTIQLQKYTVPPTPVTIGARPQRPVPGFDHAPDVTVCTDWPRTKSGGPPGAQSAIFMPLFACALGPIDNHCTAGQLDLATQWWTAALPAWPRWVQELRSSGVMERKEELVRSAKGQPNPLIPKTKGRGTVPHFRGVVQTRLLENAGGGMLSIEMYACVTCLYSCETECGTGKGKGRDPSDDSKMGGSKQEANE
mmetsp:Transcript_14319/g.41979  ORF Transcript_14319/g.41979 Transcript_14319/m.41979 type:complete len:266 (-) Transcript_14319:371-1168(-)